MVSHRWPKGSDPRGAAKKRATERKAQARLAKENRPKRSSAERQVKRTGDPIRDLRKAVMLSDRKVVDECLAELVKKHGKGGVGNILNTANAEVPILHYAYTGGN